MPQSALLKGVLHRLLLVGERRACLFLTTFVLRRLGEYSSFPLTCLDYSLSQWCLRTTPWTNRVIDAPQRLKEKAGKNDHENVADSGHSTLSSMSGAAPLVTRPSQEQTIRSCGGSSQPQSSWKTDPDPALPFSVCVSSALHWSAAKDR
jgi:hypothetical protein